MIRPATLLKKKFQHRCFPVNFVEFLRIAFFTEHLRWLLLQVIWMIAMIRRQFLIIYFSCKNYFRNWPTRTFWKICISNQKVFLTKKHVLCDSSKSVSVKLVSHARAKIKTLLFPEMWVTRKICTRAAANLFFLINSIGYSLHLKNYSKSTFTAS